MTIQVPKSAADALGFDLREQAEAYAAALREHIMGPPGSEPRPPHALVAQVVSRIPQSGPVAKRGPDEIVVDFEIYDDTPVDPAIQLLRETIN